MDNISSININEQIIKTLIDDMAKDLKQNIDRKKKIDKVKNLVKAIHDNYQILQKAKGQIELETKDSARALSNILQKQVKIKINSSDTKILDETITEASLNLYQLTGQFLQETGLNDTYDVIVGLYYKGKYYQIPGEKALTKETIRGEIRNNSLEAQQEGKKAYAALRFNTQKLAEQFAKDKYYDEKISEHFKAFRSMFKGKNRMQSIDTFNKNKTDRKERFVANEGVIVEAFQRHWYNQHNSLNSPIGTPENKAGNDPTYKEAWALYAISSGNDPYYWGGEGAGLKAQIKAKNASIISNINTVLSTAQIILQMVTANPQEISLEDYKKYFESKSAMPQKLNPKIEEILGNMSNEVLEMVQDFFK